MFTGQNAYCHYFIIPYLTFQNLVKYGYGTARLAKNWTFRKILLINFCVGSIEDRKNYLEGRFFERNLGFFQ
jgi:hypothetical protein